MFRSALLKYSIFLTRIQAVFYIAFYNFSMILPVFYYLNLYFSSPHLICVFTSYLISISIKLIILLVNLILVNFRLIVFIIALAMTFTIVIA